MLTDGLKKRLRAGDVLYGPFIDSCCEDLVEIAALAGFDYAILDAEHSPCDAAIAQRLLRAAEVRGLPALVRVNNTIPDTILKMMDIGADGVLAPLVHDAEVARRVVESVRYYPAGRRGTALMRASNYGFTPIDEYFSRTNSDAFVMVQAESVAAVENLESIVALDGLDAVFIGPYDLSQSMGIPGKVDSAELLDVVKRMGRVIRDAGKVAAIFAGSCEKAHMFVDWGFNMIAYSTDLDIYGAAVREAVAKLKAKK